MSTPVVKLWRLIIFAGATLVCEACYTGKLGVVFIFARTVTLAEQSARIGFGDFFSSLASVTCRKLNDSTRVLVPATRTTFGCDFEPNQGGIWDKKAYME